MMPAEEFFVTHFTTALAADELLTQVRFPRRAGTTGVAFEEMARRHGDFAMVGVAVMVQLAVDGSASIEARIVLTGMADIPVRATAAEAVLAGAVPGQAAFAEAAAAAVGRPRSALRSAWFGGLPAPCRPGVDPAQPGAGRPEIGARRMTAALRRRLVVNGEAASRRGRSRARPWPTSSATTCG